MDLFTLLPLGIIKVNLSDARLTLCLTIISVCVSPCSLSLLYQLITDYSVYKLTLRGIALPLLLAHLVKCCLDTRVTLFGL